MPRFYFVLNECGDVTEDPEGLVLPDLEVARAKAVEAARDIMSAELLTGKLCLSCHIEVADAARNTLLTVPFSAAVSVSGLSALRL